MERTPVTSSDLYSIGYDADSLTLEIEFKKGAVYQYYGVPQEEYQNLMCASSHGSYFNANIRNRYSYMKL
jgi:hypothetical protein